MLMITADNTKSAVNVNEKVEITPGPTHVLNKRGTVSGPFSIDHFYIQRMKVCYHSV